MATFIPFALGAQSYRAQWEAVQKAFNDDLPKSALEHVQAIRDKAAAEDNQPQLLRALCTEYVIAREISYDSTEVVRDRITDILNKETRPVERALYQCALGQLTHDNDLIRASLMDPLLLARTKATDYVPAFVIGKDSRFFADDLLSVLTMVYLDHTYLDADRMPVFGAMCDVYRAQGNEVALLLAEFLGKVEFHLGGPSTEEMIQRIRTIAPKMGRSSARTRLQEWVAAQESPYVRMYWSAHNDLYYPNSTVKLSVSSRNVQQVEIRLYRFRRMKNYTFNSEPELKNLLKKGEVELVKTDRYDLKHQPACEDFYETFDYQLPAEGIYYAALYVKGKLQETAHLKVSGVAPLVFFDNSEKKAHSSMVLVDSRSGRPLTDGVGAKFSKLEPNRWSPYEPYIRLWKDLEPAKDGTFDLSHIDDNYELAIGCGDDWFHPTFHVPYDCDARFPKAPGYHHEVRVYADRAIYRPGQKVQFGAVAYQYLGDAYKAMAETSGTVELLDHRRKGIDSRSVKTDEWGQISDAFDIPADADPGRYALKVNIGGTEKTLYFSVEEYKRPSFRIKLDEPDALRLYGRERWSVGDTLTIRGTVSTFSDVPLADTHVKWKMDYDSWFRYYGRHDGRDLKDEGDIVTDNQGRFVLTYEVKQEGFYHFSFEALSSSGEAAQAAYSAYVGYPSRPEEKVERTLFSDPGSREQAEATVVVDAAYLREIEKMAPGTPFYIFYQVVTTEGGLIHSRLTELTADSTAYTLTWRPEYGDGAVAHIAFIANGVLHYKRFGVQRPLPDKRLIMEWSTFRNTLEPGAKETWSLTVKHSDGTPADAVMMARLYDASLDRFGKEPWTFEHFFNRRHPEAYSSTHTFGLPSFHYTASSPHTADFRFTRMEPTMFSYFAYMDRSYLASGGRKAKGMLMDLAVDGMVPLAMPEAMAFTEKAMDRESADVEEAGQANGSSVDADVAFAEQMEVRENFDETAFFMPQLRTDGDGIVTLNFTLPHSLTQWNFTAFAHDTDMNIGLLTEDVVARKLLMAELAAPRFLREGDNGCVPVTIRNISENALEATVVVLVTDAATGKTIKTEKRKVAVSSGESQSFNVMVKPSADVNVRVVAKAANFSDGEERRIPVLDGREQVQVSVPFSITREGLFKVDLSPLHLQQLMKKDAKCQPRLTLEYSANPIWNVLRVLPALCEGQAIDAVDWATRLYSATIAGFIAEKLKGIAVSESDEEMRAALLKDVDVRSLKASYRDHLRDYVNADGGIAWFKGFSSSVWTTADVCLLLARMDKLTGSHELTTTFSRTYDFLNAFAEDAVKQMKKEKDPAISETLLRYLYIHKLVGDVKEDGEGRDDKTVRYLKKLAAKEKKDLTMYGKSVVAQVLRESHADASQLALESMIEHTVFTDEMGRYFDTERAFGDWTSYKIPSQTMAIETLDETAPDKVVSATVPGATASDLAAQMRLWLLQSKRTQQWESSRASADATYALLHGIVSPTAEADPFQDLSPEGYFKRHLEPAEALKAIRTASYNINKETRGLSWGAVYADYSLPLEMVEQSSAGFTVTVERSVLRDGEWRPVTADVKVGEHLRQTITVKADRDYDFVRVEAARAACLETLDPISGTTWLGSTFCYRMVRDNRNDYYFEHLAKGTHVFSEELIVDRPGTYKTGVCRVKCCFAPEFGGYAPSSVVFATSE